MDYYEALSLPRDCPGEDIQKRYDYFVKLYSPDENPDYELAQKKLLEINEAYSILINPNRRQKYDFHLMQEEKLNLATNKNNIPNQDNYLFRDAIQSKISIFDKKHSTLRKIISYLIIINLVAVFYFLLKYISDVSNSKTLAYLLQEHISWILLLLVGFFFLLVTAISNLYLKIEGPNK